MSKNKNKKPSVIIAGGGTGGHLFPGLALAESFVERGYEVHFAGTKQGLEYKVIPEEGYQLHLIPVKGIKRLGIFAKAVSILILPFAFFKSLALLRKVRPDFVVGVGGYASGPVVMTASLLGYVTAIAEQNTIPGVTNKILGKKVKRVYASFKESMKYFPEEKTVLTGNPVRKKIKTDIANKSRGNKNGKNLLVFGGSQGAHAINEFMKEIAAQLIEKGINIRHQTGKYDFEELKEYYSGQNLDVDVREFIKDMASSYAWADLVICRAGATTIAELRIAGKATIFIPFPYATDNHQEKNALSLQNEGAALCLVQKDTTAQKLADTVTELFENESRLISMSEKMKNNGFADAAEHIIDDLISISAEK